MEGEFDSSKFIERERRELCRQHIERIRNLLFDNADDLFGGIFDGDTVENAIIEAIQNEGLDRACVVAFAFMDDDVNPEEIVESIPDGLLLEMKKVLLEYQDRCFLQ